MGVIMRNGVRYSGTSPIDYSKVLVKQYVEDINTINPPEKGDDVFFNTQDNTIYCAQIQEDSTFKWVPYNPSNGTFEAIPVGEAFELKEVPESPDKNKLYFTIEKESENITI